MTQRRVRAGGFTLTELLVAVGIIAILGSVILVSVGRARRSAGISAQRFDFQTLTAALEAYRQDYHQYPMVPEYLAGTTPVYANLRMLMTGLTGYSEHGTFTSAKVYLPLDKFARTTTINNDDPHNLADPKNLVPQTIADHWGNAIEYFPRYHPDGKRSATIVGIGPIYGIASAAFPPGVAAGPTDAFFDYRDGDFGAFGGTIKPGCVKGLLWALGDDDSATASNAMNNAIAPPESSRFDGGFILISAGPDGVFCDMNDPSMDTPYNLFKKYGNIYNFDR